MPDKFRAIASALNGCAEHVPLGSGIRRIFPSVTMRTVCIVALWLLTFYRYYRYYVGFNLHQPFPLHPEAYSIARYLAERGSFANPFAPLQTGPSAHLAPAFPFLMASVMRLFGLGSLGWYVWNLIGVAVVSALVATLPLLAERYGMGFITGALAGLFWVMAKPSVSFGWEGHWVALIVAIELLIVAGSSNLIFRLSLVGILCGSVLLMSPPASIPAFATGILFAARCSTGAYSLARRILLIGSIAVFVATPWSVRNYFLFHALVPVRDDLGVELAVSYNDCAVVGIRLSERVGCFQTQHPNINLHQSQQVLRMGEVNYNRFRLNQAIAWISAHPRRSLMLCAERFSAFWFPSDAARPLDELLKPGNRLQAAVIYTMTILSFFGLLELAMRDRFSAWCFGVWLVLYPPVYYIVQYESRYRTPILWMSFLLGAFELSFLVRNAVKR
jgi:hypothetical protein